jgi:hypothetical protein
MRLCTNCWQITTGTPLFCNRCSCSYNVKLCPQKHVNPRSANCCSQCGSSELSRPQPKASLLLRPVVLLFGIGPGYLLLLGLIVYLGFFIHKLLQDPNGLLPLMCLGLWLGLLFYFWMLLPRSIRNGVQKGVGWLVRKKK